MSYHLHSLSGQAADGYPSTTFQARHRIHVGDVTGEVVPAQITAAVDAVSQFVDAWTEASKPVVQPVVGKLRVHVKGAEIWDTVGQALSPPAASSTLYCSVEHCGQMVFSPAARRQSGASHPPSGRCMLGAARRH